MIRKDQHAIGIAFAFWSSKTTLAKVRRCEKDCPKKTRIQDRELFKSSWLQRSAWWLLGFWYYFNCRSKDVHSCWSGFLCKPRTTSLQSLFLRFHTFYHFYLPLFHGSSICCLRIAFFALAPVDFLVSESSSCWQKLRYLGGTIATNHKAEKEENLKIF